MEMVDEGMRAQLKPRIAWSWGGFVFNWLYPVLAGNPIWSLPILLLYFLLCYPSALGGYDAGIYTILQLILCPVYVLGSLLLGLFGRNLVWMRRRRVRPEMFPSDQRIVDLVGMYLFAVALTVTGVSMVVGFFFDALWRLGGSGGT